MTEYISGGELFNRITTFTHKLVQLYVLEIAIAIGKYVKEALLRTFVLAVSVAPIRFYF